MENKIYDLIIVGAGPAGLGASIYASRYKLDHLVIGSEIGGQVVEAWEIENYAGFEKISGKDLMGKFVKQSEKLGGKIIKDSVNNIVKTETGFKVVGEKTGEYTAQSIILALGMKPRKMNVPGEDRFLGKGVSYCATCDAMFFRGKDVVVIGGGDSAATAAIHLTEFANKVTLIYKDEKVSFEPAWIEQMKANPKIEMICCSNITEIKGDTKVSGIVYEMNGPASTRGEDRSSTRGGEKKELAVQGVFIEVGTFPGAVLAKNLGVKTDDQDYIIVDGTQATSIENVYSAGDIDTSSNKFRQIITAVAEGAVAAGSIYKKLKLKPKG
ncbi:MAG: FAD-dependent oxidoreductase [Candidatus Moranbacteria bacterium]|nr:FAD-dependent oxidoreductase [Candidatus Moranbacteria bacterium]